MVKVKSVEQVLKDAELSVKPLSERQLNAILLAMLSLSNEGVLITDLNHIPIACNQKFGDIFLVHPNEVTKMEVEELRSYVYPRLRDPESWRNQLDRIYSAPDCINEDELDLVLPSPTIVRRRTIPLVDSENAIIGRLWSFHDVTAERRREKRREVMMRVSTYYHPEPADVLKNVLRELSDFYDAPAILSLYDGDFLTFRETCRVPDVGEELKGNSFHESYCKVAIQNRSAIIIQDGSVDSRLTGAELPMRFGMKRYLGAPLIESGGTVLGTICFLDQRPDEPLGDEDLEFITVLAQRLSTELERERLFSERSAEQQAVLERQRQELETTQNVLSAMNSAFNLLGQPLSRTELLLHQVSLAQNLLGFSSAAILERTATGLAGCLVNTGKSRARTDSIPLESSPLDVAFDGPRNALCKADLENTSLAKFLGNRYVAFARLPLDFGNTVVVLGSKAPVRSGDHHETHLTALIDQIALLVMAHQLNSELTSALIELEATQERLVQSEKLSVVGTLSASIAHDIRNIVASILLECSMPVNDVEAFRGSVKNQLERFSILANRLLAYAKPKAISRVDTDLKEVIDQAVEMLNPQARMWKCQVDVALEPEIPLVAADAHRVQHLFVNLILNAMQAMNSGGGRLEVSSQLGRNQLVILLSDTGRGIPDDRIAHIFEPFVSSRADGFGLGLFSCKQIADEHGWSIGAESKIGLGTTFTISIPLDHIGEQK